LFDAFSLPPAKAAVILRSLCWTYRDIREARRFSLSGAVQNDNDQKDDTKCLMYMLVMENIQLAVLNYTPENCMGILSYVLGGRPRESSGGI
jgi:hypothetical protein